MDNNYFQYLDITPSEYRWGSYVTSLGFSKSNPRERYPNPQHPKSYLFTWDRGRILNEYQIHYIFKGKGCHSSSLTNYTKIDTGNCFLLFPGVKHRYKPDYESGWEEFWVGFNGSQIKHLMNEGIFNTSKPIINMGYDSDMFVLFSKLIEIVKNSPVGYPQQLSGITLQILGLLYTKANYIGPTNNPDEKLIEKAKFIMQKSFKNNISMEEISQELPMGYSSFRKKFKQLSGESPNQYMLNLRLERAKYLLATTVLNISEIANQIGLDNVFYFSKLFKEKNGISPKNFRETLNKS